MKKGIIIGSISAIIIIALCGWFYYYQYVEEVTDRYFVKYILPHEEKGMFGSKMSQPELELSVLSEYASDSAAVERESKKAALYKERLLEKFKNEKFDEANELTNEAKKNAYIDLLNEQRMIISITHVRSTDAKEALEIIKKHGLFSDDVEEFAKKNKLKAHIYPL